MSKTGKRNDNSAKAKRNRVHASFPAGQSSQGLYKREEHFKIAPKHPGKGRS